MRALVVIVAATLTACGSGQSEEERAARDAADVAEVEAASVPPMIEITPETIRYPDIEAHQMFGVGCSFTPDGGGLGATAITLLDAGFMKVGGEVERFAPDAGSAETGFGTRTKYDGRRHSMRLLLTEQDGEQKGPETFEYDARLEVRDGQDRVVYASDGYAQCGA